MTDITPTPKMVAKAKKLKTGKILVVYKNDDIVCMEIVNSGKKTSFISVKED